MYASRKMVGWSAAAVCMLCAVASAEATIRSVLTRWSPTGGVTVLEDGVVVSSFDIPVSPHGVAATADGSTLYATYFNQGTLSKIDVDNGQLVATIPTGEGAIRVSLNAAETRAYVANRDANNVSIVDTASFEVLLTAPAPPLPRSVIVGPEDQFLYVAHNGLGGEPDSVSKRWADTGILFDSIELGDGWPGALAITPDGSELLVALEASEASGIARIDLDTFTLTEVVPLTHRPSWILFHPSGSPWYVTSWFDHALLTLDPRSLEVLDVLEIQIYPAGADITPDGKQIHIMRGAGTEAFIVDTATNSIVDQIDVGGNSRGFGKFITGEPPPPDDDVPASSGVGLLVQIAVMIGLLTVWMLRARRREHGGA
jgi:DNA-binding beta-propeller fold protein YncE